MIWYRQKWNKVSKYNGFMPNFEQVVGSQGAPSPLFLFNFLAFLAEGAQTGVQKWFLHPAKERHLLFRSSSSEEFWTSLLLFENHIFSKNKIPQGCIATCCWICISLGCLLVQLKIGRRQKPRTVFPEANKRRSPSWGNQFPQDFRADTLRIAGALS